MDANDLLKNILGRKSGGMGTLHDLAKQMDTEETRAMYEQMKKENPNLDSDVEDWMEELEEMLKK
jgi:HD superfamily phosphohydrolase YqeK